MHQHSIDHRCMCIAALQPCIKLMLTSCCMSGDLSDGCCCVFASGGVVLRDNQTQETRNMPLSGLFFAIGHAPATAFLEGQLELDEYGYIITAPDSTATSIPGLHPSADWL